MSAHFAQAKECQVFERDLHDILLFPHITLSTLQSVLTTTKLDDDKCHNNRNESLSAKLTAIYTLTQTALTESSLREQVTNGLVKVAVPRFRREALIDHNVFVQRILAQHNEEQTKKQEEESEQKQKLHKKHEMEAQRVHSDNIVKNNNSKSNENDRSSASVPYRVGRIVAILPKPGSEQNELTSKLADSSSSTGDTNNNYEDSLSTFLSSVYNTSHNKTALYNKWLIAVHFGEAVEVLNLKTIINDQFTEEEFQVYIQSSLATSLNASYQGKLSSAGPNVFLTSEQAEGQRTKLHTLRTSFQLLHDVCQVQGNQLPGVNTMNGKVRGEVIVQNEKVNKAASAIMEHHSEEEESLSSQYKRSRMEFEEEYEENSDRKAEEKKCVNSSNNESYNAQLTIAALHSREREMVEQIHKLRELIVIRDNELAHSLQTQRQMEKTHQSELAQWRTKLDEEAQGRQRMQRELSSSMKDKTALLDEANVKLRRLAEMTMKYKRIVDEVKRKISEAVKHGDGYTVKQVNLDTPEAILAQLKQATLHTSN